MSTSPDRGSNGAGISTGGAIVGMLIAGVLGFFLRGVVDKHGGVSGLTSSSGGATTVDSVPPGAVDPAVERFRIPVGSAPVHGRGDAKVTIIEISDFQCPFCSRAAVTVDQVEKQYGKNVRLAFKHNPLPFHPNAGPAAEAAMAAGEQGKFFEMHDLLFKNQQTLDRASFEKHAAELKLDMGKFKAALDSGKYKQQIKDDTAEAAKFGARGTPAFFINGRFLSGAQPFDAFKKIVDEEIVNADKAIKAGVPASAVYDALTKNGKPGSDAAAPPTKPQGPRPPQPVEPQVYKVPVGNSPAKGPAGASVTIVVFSDFQCPFCSRVEGSLSQVEKEYAGKVRFVWKNNPLPFHPNAGPAAKAALAAGEQGKFWEMHDKIFANQQALDRPTFERYATELQLNAAKFKAALDNEDKYKKSIDEDMALAARIGARGTPCFYINGRALRGAQPYESFKKAVDEGLVEANALLAKGVTAANLYTELTKNGLDKAAPAPAQPGAPDANTVYRALTGDAPMKGAKNAKVTIVEFSDFQCPFCSRVEPTVDQVMKAYPNDVRVFFKQLPLPFHNNAHLAAQATLAAKEQGKFWEMHKALFANQSALDRAGLEKIAGELQLNMDKFKAALDSGKFKAKVDEELAEGNKIGARGTPSFFVNGKSFVGAQPFDGFKAKIEEEIKNADAIIAKAHVKPGDQLYAYIMKDAKAEVAAAAPGGKPGAPTPAGEDDKTVIKVEPGNGPSMGPPGAPVQLVIFSDFQCPFCTKVEPTLKQVMDKYKGKVRLTWRDYPLPFHNNAMPAAEAARAAHEQGKFWEMHDKLFANQGSLDRASFEKYAAELQLDVNKFKADLDSGRMKGPVNADVTYANSLPGGGMGTPTVFINGRKKAGAYPFEEFAKIIDEELKKKGR